MLCLVAIAQLRLTRTDELTPWKGGGFGMFATNDDGNRRLGIRISGPWGDRAIPVPRPLVEEAFRASFLPTDRRLRELGRKISAIEAAKGVPVSRVHIAVWRLDYDSTTLAPHRELVRQLIVEVPEPVGRR